MAEVRVGEQVEVLDEGLAQLREIMRRATGREPKPNHHGVVEQIEDGLVYILFNDTGQLAPYPLAEVRRLT
ncbi:hypothetical protein [Promicromonospora sp. NFX87]|uniref:hypothetical protein n=1 Tax=Promicromonospora sp. NFX87 TaxID=3402691 RepID=UPI003AFAC175